MKFEKAEILRKLLHLITLIFPFSFKYIFEFRRKEFAYVIFILFLAAFLIETIRLLHRPSKKVFYQIFGFLLRRHEIFSISGATFLLASILVSILAFPVEIAFMAICFLIVGDTFAALVGKRLGRRVLLNKKTVEGTLAFIVSCFIFAFFFNANLSWIVISFGIFSAAIIELTCPMLDDNLAIPIGSGVIMFIFNRLLV